ncbi:MAG TPA: hypothetical protein ENN50_02335 [Prosthecochloris aestuarii]|uniref:Glycosyl transferase family 2 n=1 Tax=Prosthecochloris aestuarii TaxID=1102 RepID=A0A831WND4_PROAE|nr:hypothetical protein [Prosthecochloris aestuarii]
MPATQNIIIRPVFNRPEMLKVSIDHEILARKRLKEVGYQDNYITFFLIEYGTSQRCIKVIGDYPFKSRRIYREKNPYPITKHKKWRTETIMQNGLTRNIMEGMKAGFSQADDHILILEDDIMVHSSYFHFLSVLLDTADLSELSVICTQHRGMYANAVNNISSEENPSADPSEVRWGHDYNPWGPLISKTFFNDYIRQFASEDYYRDRPTVIMELDRTYAHLQAKGYKYAEGMHNEQAGLINRLVDLAMIEKQRYALSPSVDRTVHTGFYGANRGKGRIPGLTFQNRCKHLARAIEGNRLKELNTSRKYTDYPSFSPVLDNWDETVRITG